MKGYKWYKDSNEYWLGQIPIHWKTIRLKLISSISKGKKPIVDYDKYEDGLYPYLSMEYLRGKSDEPIYANPNEGNLLLVKEGDLIILWDGSNAGEIVRSKAGILSSTMAKIEINNNDDFNSSFLNYYLQIAQVHIQNNTIGMGIPHVNGNILKDLILFIPPLSEQIQIASFLDRKTALIDEIIVKKERLIETLQAKRQATINEVVTGKKVWNPKTNTWTEASKVKNSGIDWLGEIPTDWEVVKLKYLVSMKSGNFISADLIEEIGEYPIYGGNGIRGYYKEFTHEGFYPLIGRQGALCGNINYADGKFWATEHAVVVDRIKNIDLFWMGELLKLMNLNQYSIATAQPGLSVERILNLRVPFPNTNTQNIISNYIKDSELKLSKLLSKISTQIQKLKEYRQSLISEAVTGKIDVSENNEQ